MTGWATRLLVGLLVIVGQSIGFVLAIAVFVVFVAVSQGHLTHGPRDSFIVLGTPAFFCVVTPAVLLTIMRKRNRAAAVVASPTAISLCSALCVAAALFFFWKFAHKDLLSLQVLLTTYLKVGPLASLLGSFMGTFVRPWRRPQSRAIAARRG